MSLKGNEIVDAVVTIIEESSKRCGSDFARFINTSEDDIAKYHHTVGRGLRNAYSLWDDNPLTWEFRSIGIWHADDMSHTLLLAVHRICNHKKVNLRAIRQEFIRHWEQYDLNGLTGEEQPDANQSESRT